MNSGSTSSGQVKRKRKSISDKIALLKKFRESGLTLTQFAQTNGVHRSLLHRYLKSEDKLNVQEDQGLSSFFKVRRLEFPLIDKAVYLWICQMKQCGMPITDDIVRLKAKEFSLLLNNNDDFRSSPGWLEAFKCRHANLHRIIQHGECRSADKEAAELSVPLLNELMSSFNNDDRINIDETGLLWRCLPSRSLGSAPVDSEGFKKPKDRITVVVISSASGSLFEIFVIGKSKRPLCFRGKVLHN